MRRLLWLLLLMPLAGCADDAPVPLPDGAAACSQAIKDDSRPDGQPFGEFDHSLTNRLGHAVQARVDHLHESGCSLGAYEGALEPDQVLDITYQKHLWDADRRTIQWADQRVVEEHVDWACSWDKAITAQGLQAGPSQMCA